MTGAVTLTMAQARIADVTSPFSQLTVRSLTGFCMAVG